MERATRSAVGALCVGAAVAFGARLTQQTSKAGSASTTVQGTHFFLISRDNDTIAEEFYDGWGATTARTGNWGGIAASGGGGRRPEMGRPVRTCKELDLSRFLAPTAISPRNSGKNGGAPTAGTGNWSGSAAWEGREGGGGGTAGVEREEGRRGMTRRAALDAEQGASALHGLMPPSAWAGTREVMDRQAVEGTDWKLQWG